VYDDNNSILENMRCLALLDVHCWTSEDEETKVLTFLSRMMPFFPLNYYYNTVRYRNIERADEFSLLHVTTFWLFRIFGEESSWIVRYRMSSGRGEIRLGGATWSTNRGGTVTTIVSLIGLTLWRPLLSYGYSYKASCGRPG